MTSSWSIILQLLKMVCWLSLKNLKLFSQHTCQPFWCSCPYMSALNLSVPATHTHTHAPSYLSKVMSFCALCVLMMMLTLFQCTGKHAFRKKTKFCVRACMYLCMYISMLYIAEWSFWTNLRVIQIFVLRFKINSLIEL